MSHSQNNIALTVSGLNKSYGDFAVLKDLHLTINSGSILGLVGLNGSGKTTTIECILGMKSFNGGEIAVLDHSPAQLHSMHGDVVGIFDTPSLHPNLTVRQCLDHARIFCKTQVRSTAEVEKLLHISAYSKFKIKNLSLGNKRRASIAQALLGSPRFVVLDEPFNGLDAGGVDDVLKLIRSLNEKEGTTFLLSSHQLPYLEQICSHIAILHKGTIALSDEVGKLLANSELTALIKTEQLERAQSVITDMQNCEYLGIDGDGYIRAALNGIDSSELNHALVSQQIAVSEIILKRASLAHVFREISSGVDK